MKHGSVSQIVDSPIEKHFLDGWIASHLGARHARVDWDEHAEKWKACLLIEEPLREFHIFTQYHVAGHRVDFLVRSLPSLAQVIVECDGHAFHETTKEQVAKDRKRERQLIRAGYTVLRFTGSELYGDAAACAKEVEEILQCTHMTAH
jgi:very-short-patch-repair endonuclease